MLTVISGELAIDLDRVVCIEKAGGGGGWVVRFDGGMVAIRDFERIRIWEILGEKVNDRYGPSGVLKGTLPEMKSDYARIPIDGCV